MNQPSPEIELTLAEMLLGASVGVMRQVENVKLKRQHAHGAARDNEWPMHIEGALGEMALAKFTRQFWSGNLRESTALLSIPRGASLIEYSMAFCAANDVDLSDPNDYRTWSLGHES